MTKNVFWLIYTPLILAGIAATLTYTTITKLTQIYQQAEAGTHPK